VDARGIHHVAMAVEDLEEAIATYRRVLGADLELRETLDGQGVEAAYLRVGDGRVELLSALGDDTPVGRFLARRGPGMHHLAVAVPDVGAAIEALRSTSATLVDEAPRPGLGGRPVAFVHPDTLGGVLLEVVAE
jgi:methylmalonyl-CoA epimerase